MKDSGRIVLSGFCPGALPNPSVHFRTEASVGSVPRSPRPSEHKAGPPRAKGFHHPQGILDAWPFGLVGVQIPGQEGGRADLCLPENRPKPLSLLSAVGGMWWRGGVSASLGQNRQLQSGPWSPSGRGARETAYQLAFPGAQRPEPPWPSERGPWVEPFWAGETSDIKHLRSVLKGFRPQDCPFAYNSGKRLRLS